MSTDEVDRDLKAIQAMRKYLISPMPVYSPAVGWRWRISYDHANLMTAKKQALAQWEWDVDTTADLTTLSFGFKVFNDPAIAVLTALAIIEGK